MIVPELDKSLNAQSPLKTKRKLKITEKNNSNNDEKQSKRNSNSSNKQSYDPEELDKTIQEI